MSNSLGKIFTLTTFGESHGEAIGGIIDGCPAGIELNFEAIQNEMNRRKPGQSKIVTQRKEPDEVQFLSGIFEGKTTGASIGFIINNVHQRSNDYSHIKDSYRPSHAARPASPPCSKSDHRHRKTETRQTPAATRCCWHCRSYRPPSRGRSPSAGSSPSPAPRRSLQPLASSSSPPSRQGWHWEIIQHDIS